MDSHSYGNKMTTKLLKVNYLRSPTTSFIKGLIVDSLFDKCNLTALILKLTTDYKLQTNYQRSSQQHKFGVGKVSNVPGQQASHFLTS